MWIMPGRKRRGGELARSSTEDSMPTFDGPPSTMRGMRPPKSFRTCSALVGEIWLERLALGAASGKPHSRMTAWMKGWSGHRTPTVGPLAVTTSGICGERGRTRVNGPGQNASASLPACGGQSETQRRASSRLATWTMMGLCDGRPLASKMRRTASASQALAARP
jgi:hypothetical protein